MSSRRTAALIVALLSSSGCAAERAGADSIAAAPAASTAVPPSARPAPALAAAQAQVPGAAAAPPATAAAAVAAESAAAEPPLVPTQALPAPPPGRAWHDVRSPAAGAARSIGGYSAGCIAGAQRLAVEGPGYLVMRPGRRRHFGHPQLVDFVRSLGGALAPRKLGGLVIGDLGQPRGGPAPDGHASHQIGLDADIWYPLAQTADGIPASARTRRKLRALPVANFVAQRLTDHWSPRVGQVLQLAVADPRVDRIFVNPMIKRALCQSEQERTWLRKLRPWWGHDAHFHVRLGCPADSPACRPQAALPAGDGCDTVDWWFSKEATADRDEERAKYRARVGPGDLLPAECNALLAQPD